MSMNFNQHIWKYLIESFMVFNVVRWFIRTKSVAIHKSFSTKVIAIQNSMYLIVKACVTLQLNYNPKVTIFATK